MRTSKMMTLFLTALLIASGCKATNSEDSSSQNIEDSIPSLNSGTETVNNSSESTETPSENSPSIVEPPSSESSETPPPTSETVDPPLNEYYSDINGMSFGTTLLNEVRSLITRTHKTQTTYSGLANVFKTSDADPNRSGNVLWFYTGTSKAFSGFGGSTGQTNREHVWPKDGGKAFPAESKAGSDSHHLRPMETTLNSTRGSKSFGIVAQTTANIAKENGSSSYASGDYLSYKQGNFFYPGKGWRGQTARILFYVQARWGGDYNLKFVLGSGSSKTIGDMETLMKWHLEEPVNAFEMTRNEVVYKVQGNRNPFIDVPEYACKIYANDGQSYNSKVKAVCGL